VSVAGEKKVKAPASSMSSSPRRLLLLLLLLLLLDRAADRGLTRADVWCCRRRENLSVPIPAHKKKRRRLLLVLLV
jgi:hypothetical protein